MVLAKSQYSQNLDSNYIFLTCDRVRSRIKWKRCDLGCDITSARGIVRKLDTHHYLQ